MHLPQEECLRFGPIAPATLCQLRACNVPVLRNGAAPGTVASKSYLRAGAT